MILEMVYLKPRITLSFMAKKLWPLIPPVIGLQIGAFFDQYDSKRYLRFRDKSALYGKKLAEGEPPSW